MLKIKKNDIGKLFIVIGMFFLSGHSLSIISSPKVKILFILLTIFGCFIIHPKIEIKKNLSDKKIFIVLIFTGILLSQIFYMRYNPIAESFMLMGRILAAYYICVCIEENEFYNIFSTLLGILTIVALVVHFLVEYNIPVPNYTYVSAKGFIYHTIGICTWEEMSNELCGPFWETGLYCSMAIYALICEYCLKKEKSRKWIMVILVCGIFVSGSTAGYLLLALTIYIIVFSKRKHKWIIDVVTMIIVILVFIYWEPLVQILYNWKPDVFWKLTEESVTINTRLYSPIACLSVFLKNPLFGFGQNYAIDHYNLLKPLYGIDSLTSTTTFMMAAFGVFGISYTYLMFKAVFKQKQYSLNIRVLLFILFFIIVNKEPHTSIILTYIMLFYLSDRRSKSV